MQSARSADLNFLDVMGNILKRIIVVQSVNGGVYGERLESCF